ncbi:enterochelin esterase [Acrocarpospora pleiomorpha]|uniref:Enterochelin esterase n=1 Tax=Acrocarpospora pleiomorpha TaxID=90975 RepID=A0A5M3XZP7_9ACTN|nr:alpha/beta hydrolase-fold protein [Acrocarpospora pleiomorpha]GES23848.1 enterochelin esterase [Acrocarpospora pleiomorpha]
MSGRVEKVTIVSEELRGNALGDPYERPLWIYLPPGYDDTDARYPSIYVLQGYSGQVTMWGNRAAWRRNYPELLDELFASGETPPAIVVFVDAWTRLGGSQYVDSPGHGRYHSYLCEEIVPYVDARYRTLAGKQHRAITGKSSGGYGAMITPMLRPGLFGALATHAGDALFDVLYLRDFPKAARTLRDEYDGSWTTFLDRFFATGGRCPGQDMILLYGNAASYSSNPDGTVDIPFDDLGHLLPEVWDRWREYDPVTMATERPETLRGLHSIWIDAGKSDEYFLDLGATAFHRAVQAAGVPAEDVVFELFDGTHSNLEHRYVLAVKWLAPRLTPENLSREI